jgi:hypothetical protein
MIKMRQEVERKIATAVVTSALNAGYTITIDNGSDVETPKLHSIKSILDAMFQTDDEYLHMWKDGKRFGWVFFVYGNDGWDVISDYTTNLEHIMDAANKISKHYED